MAIDLLDLCDLQPYFTRTNGVVCLVYLHSYLHVFIEQHHHNEAE